MADQPASGELFGIPYNFEKPSLRGLLSSYWQPGEEMLVKKEFGIGYTLNLANWRSWIVLAVVGALLYQERSGSEENDEVLEEGDEDEPVEVVVD
ncbi:hypothetical protein GRX03_10520 [Halovenus sp. WSH3]|uniref:DUF5808 domain-containing protein n=1 Tax=Halovenus carboxidivorans TaxID=2692199 RepID=A0A6B0T9W1_9EURY|nr:DUF5808 domain-containing protein [Halovenus carboxidivorans]MXR52031.1 hypothetical protein [Halovenus carboxidivorans]